MPDDVAARRAELLERIDRTLQLAVAPGSHALRAEGTEAEQRSAADSALDDLFAQALLGEDMTPRALIDHILGLGYRLDELKRSRAYFRVLRLAAETESS